MKKLFLIGTLLCVLCSCGSGNSKKNAAPANGQEGNESAAPSDVCEDIEDWDDSINEHEGYEWVDLGLPSGLKWAICNVGASCPEEYGDYFAWGEIRPKSSYERDNSVTYGESWSDITGDSSSDAARANWGGNWRMPTKAECQELIDNCNWTQVTQNGQDGYLVTGTNGESIFLPVAGYRNYGRLENDGDFGRYWTSTPYEGNKGTAYYLGFSEGGDQHVHNTPRSYGFSVRPVLD